MDNLEPATIINTPNDQKPLENAKKEEFEINKEGKLILSFNDSMISFNIKQNSLPKKEFELIISLERLYKISKFFINFENTKDLVNWLIDSLKKNNSTVKFNKNICLIQILNPITNKLFDLSLNIKKEDLNSRVTYLEEINIQQNKEIELLKEKIRQFESILPIIEKLNLKLKAFEEKKRKNFFSDSEILNNQDKDLLIQWLPLKLQKTILLINSKIDGDKIKTIADKLEGKNPTLVIIKSKDGYKFGGYAAQKWKNNTDITDNNAFVFSLDKKKKYNIIKPEKSYYLSLNNWWGFGANDNAIVLLENCTSKNTNYIDNKTYNIQEKYELNGGNRYFTVENFEVFLIE